MRIVVMGRLFSGLADGLSRGEWTPRGVPAFYKLVESLHADPDVSLRTMLFCKDPDLRFRRARSLRTERAGRIDIVPWRAPTGGRIKKLDRLATESDHMVRVVWLGLTARVDLVYATYALVLPASVLARVFRKRVVLRLMGLFPQHRAMARGEQPLFRWAMRAPYARVVCTEDGSDPSEILPRIVGRGTKVEVRLNGCDLVPGPSRNIDAEGPLKVAFLGRLEGYKGADLFVEAALATESEAISFEIIGDGPLRQELEARSKGSPNIVFRGALTHAEAAEALRNADVYVSVNLHGNLSNANLEALAAGCAMVLPSPDRATPIDLATERLISADAAVRYDREAVPTALAAALTELAKDRDRVSALRAKARETASALLRPWTERVDADKQSLKSLVADRAA
jgi:glycosyltransferase involved in cell wall biosynthesis